MTPAADGHLVERLFERLLVAVGPEGFDGPVTIGDVYQRLIPYRTVRSEIGVMELASYEHGLLRLLGGEGGHLEVRGESAAEEIRRELASPNPILGIYRDYPDVPVRIRGGSNAPAEATFSEKAPDEKSPAPDSADGGRAGSPQKPVSIPAAPAMSDPTSASRPGETPSVGHLNTGIPGPADRIGIALAASDMTHEASETVAAVCDGCGSDLPAMAGVRFCPYCGQVREPIPCGRCGTRLEPEWNFCIGCGTAVAL